MSPITISDYYGYDHLTAKLRALEEAAPDLFDLGSIGRSREGRKLWLATVANDRVGPPAGNRPALLVTANMHANEYAGSWVSLHLLRHLVEAYGEDTAVTELLDERAVYVVPRVAPDGAEAKLETANKAIRSRDVTVPREDRKPNALYHEDVNGDGLVLEMRWEDEDGEMCADPEDDRLLVDRTANAKGPFYRTAVEGTVHEYEGGELIEHEVRSDFNRNFPSRAWRPFDWYGNGPYPLSEPETRALAEFVLDHPNVVGVADLHTGNPALFYPSALVDTGEDRQSDAALIDRLGKRGEELTGFPSLSSYAEAAEGTATTELPGSFKDFVYERTGAPAFVVELGMLYNSLGLETTDLGRDDHHLESNRLLMEFHEANPEYGLFHEWEPFDHPQLGEVEIGGWDSRKFGNPPPGEMPSIAERTTEFLLEYAAYAPSVRVRNLRAEHLGDDLYRVSATVGNRGTLPTNLTEQGKDTQQDDPPSTSLRGDVEIITGRRHRQLDHLEAGGGRATFEWVVRGSAETDIELRVTSSRGVCAADSTTLEL